MSVVPKLPHHLAARADAAVSFVDGIAPLLGEVGGERFRQHEKWGEQNHPDGTGGKYLQTLRNAHQQRCRDNFKNGRGTFADILTEEVYEALAEDDRTALRMELIQIAAVAIQWVEKLDREAKADAQGPKLDHVALTPEGIKLGYSEARPDPAPTHEPPPPSYL